MVEYPYHTFSSKADKDSMDNVSVTDFLNNLHKPKQAEEDGIATYVVDRARSQKVDLALLPKAYRNLLNSLASSILDTDDRGLIVMGFPKAGKSFAIEQVAHNIEEYLPKSHLSDLKMLYINDTNLMELGNSKNLRNWVKTLTEELEVEEENLCFVTESVEAAVFFMTTLHHAKVVLEVNFDTLMMIFHNNSRSASKMWAAWQIFDVNIPRFTEADVVQVLQETIVKRLNAKAPHPITPAQIRKFVKQVAKVHPNAFVEVDDDKFYSIIPLGAWSVAMRHLTTALSFVTDEDYLDANGNPIFLKVMKRVVDECEDLFNLFLNSIRTVSSDEEEEDEGEGIPQEIARMIFDGQRVMTVGERGKKKEVTPLVFKEVMSLKDRLNKTIMGQDTAVEQVAKSLVVPAAGLHDSHRPLKSFLFLGPTGVGKTQLALDLANEVSDEPLHVIRIDMSEYQHEHEVAKLFGAPPGYVGFERGGRLTSAVAEHPHSIVLLDEVEKAHPKIWDTFLQVFDSGRMTDSQGNVIDFTQTIIVMTSNLGVDELNKTATGFGVGNDATAYENRQKNASLIVMKAVEKFFRPEFINRIDEIVTFKELNSDVITSIIEREVGLVRERATARGVKLGQTPASVISTLLQKSDISKYGAREIQRVVFKNVSNPVASFMVMNPTVKNLSLTSENDEISVSKTTPERRKNV